MLKIAAIAALTCLSALPASAAVITVTGSGTMNYGYDTTNYLGLGTDLTGRAATIVFAYDTDNLPNRYTYETGSYSQDSAARQSGTTGDDGVPFFLQSYFEIDGVRQDVVGYTAENISLWHETRYQETHIYQIGSREYVYGPPEINSSILIDSGGLPADVRSLEDVFSIGAGYGSGYISFGAYRNNDYNDPIYRVNAWLSLTSLTVTSDAVIPSPEPGPSPVPLPAGAPLVLSGLAALFGLRRLKRRVA